MTKELLFFILKEYGWIILAFLGAIFYTIMKAKKVGNAAALNELRQVAYGLMLMAEKKFGDGEGHLKMSYVIDRFWPAVPNTVKFLVTKEDAEAFLQGVYEDLKDIMDDGIRNDSTAG